MLKRMAGIGAGVLLTGATLIAGATEAQAEPGGCKPGQFCAWYYSDYSGPAVKEYGDATWPGAGGLTGDGKIGNDDTAWFNNGTPCAGCDHVRVYNVGSTSGKVTLCVHLGHWGKYNKTIDTHQAYNKGDMHRWGPECRSGEPQL
ncbi:peptidase inhibitor family I36 protein [Kribbella sp. NBC_00482]|uniref:peptidase inhibitor family I36 protein n=1 Tax=Kribbella sp. NBC_00482 TaxID=2975968 RepID=UPI002E17FB6B